MERLFWLLLLLGRGSGSESEQCASETCQQQLPALPGSATTPRIVLGEATSMLDVLGPLVVHEDGTTGRIANWHEMTSAEQANVVRVLGRRNKKRLERLRSQAQEKPSGAGAICVVTGASGFIASTLVKQLCERGFMVRGTVRSLGDKAKVEHLYGLCPAERLTLHQADLLSDGSFESAIDGADIVFHTASPFFMGGFSDAQAELIEPAVNGTRNVISSAIAAGVKRIVLTSSMAAIADAKNDVPAPDKVYTEDDWNNVSTILNNPYALSKTMAERTAWQLVSEARERVRLVVINPSFVFGPVLSGRADSTSVKLMRSLLESTIASAPPGCFGLTDVRDVAYAHIEAAIRDDAHGRYIVSTESSYTMLEIADMLRPKFAAYSLPTEGPQEPARVVMRRSHAKAHTRLGVEFTDIQRTMEDMAESMLQFGLVSQR